MALRIAFTALGIGALMIGFWQAAIVAFVGVVFDLLYLQPEIDAADAAVEAAGIDGDDGRGGEIVFTVIMVLVVILIMAAGADVAMRGG